ncbi:MAG: PAS domain-containing sensor histidine kinase [Ignavibacteriaceae bacterium]|nr:PAS domain-containing sensor histidine kinase [Ignavibacteriaceae bacterium]
MKKNIKKNVKKSVKKKTEPKTKKPATKQMDDVQRLVYLLQVHQVELEHQNEELRIAQEELEVSRNKYVSLFDFSPIPYFTLNPEGIIKESNLSASQMFGIDRNKLIGKHFNTLIPVDERDIFHSFISTVFNSIEKQSCEFSMINKDKRLFHVRLEGLELDDLLESEKKCQVALIDLTEYKRVENSLTESNEELKALNIAKDKFFSIIAHDLRSPFQSLLGFSEILATEIDTLSNEEIVIFSKGLNDDLRNIYGLLDNLLQWSMIQRNMLEHNPENVNVYNLANKIIGISNQIAKEKNISIFNNIENGTFVYADNIMLRSVIQNLIINAIKFTEKEGRIVISSVEKSHLIEVSVEDTGTGIPTKLIPDIFSFNQIFTTNGTAGEKGTGLGLPICKEFVERNEGKIWVETEPGKGSKFVFTLPKPIS